MTGPKKQRTHPAADVDKNTSEGNTSRRRQERIPSTSAVKPTTSGRNDRRRVQMRTPDTDEGESGTGKEIVMPSRPRSSPTSNKDAGASETGPKKKRTHPTSNVDQNTSEGNTSRRRQERMSSTSAVEPTTSGRKNRHRVQQRWTPDTDEREPGTDEENVFPSRPRSSPTSNKDAGVSATGPKKKRTHPTSYVDQNTSEGNTSRKRRERATSGRKNRRRVQRRTPDTDDEEPGTNEENFMPSRSSRTSVFEDLTPAERAIPDTTLLHKLGHHLSAFARAGRGPPTQNLNCRGAWSTAVELYHGSNDQYKALFIAAGFGDFLNIEPVELPVTYSLALMERWFSETNTLHLPCGEIGPTPLDWTMVTGLRFGGQCIGVNTNFSMSRALYLLGKPGAQKDGKILLSEIVPSPNEVREDPPTDDAKEKVFRRLFLYVVSSCFFNNNRSLISHKLVECLERIDEVGTYDWGRITYSAFLSGMRRKVTAEIGAFTAFWQFLPYWAFEYLDINRPMHIKGNVFPRAKRWICPKISSKKDTPNFFGPQFLASRCQLNFVEDSQVTWQPYLASSKYSSDSMKSTINLAKKRIAFQSIETWEYYLGERCLRQFGFPCRVPNDPPQIMHGAWEGQNEEIWNGISAENLVNQSLDYSSWFATASVRDILNVNPFLGGVNNAEKVLSQWMAKHQPDFILISEAEYIEMKEDCSAVEEECAKLQGELMPGIAQPNVMNNYAASIPSTILSDKASFHPEEAQLEVIKLKPAIMKGLVQNDDGDCIAIDPPPPPSGEKAPRLCELAVDSIDNKVALGVVFPREDELNDKIHGRPLQPGCLRVSVTVCINPDVLLPVPIAGEMEKVSQAVGSYVAWPQNLIIFPTDVINNKEVLKSKKDELDELRRTETLCNQTEPSENVLERFWLLYEHATTSIEVVDALNISCDVEVFGGDRTIFLLQENLIDLFKFDRIGQAIISAYMMHLHTLIRESGKLETFSFFDPSATFLLNDNYEYCVVKRMLEGNVDRMFFLPHCDDEHWILAIMWNGGIYILNPLAHDLIRFPKLEKALIGALKTINAETGKGEKVPEVKYLSGSPKQPGGNECGYVVMRYMKDIIEDKELSFPAKWLNNSLEFYSMEQLDEVRFETLNYIQERLIS